MPGLGKSGTSTVPPATTAANSGPLSPRGVSSVTADSLTARLPGGRRAFDLPSYRRLPPPPAGRLLGPLGRPPRLVLRLAVGREPGRGALAARAGASSDAVAFGWRCRSARGATSPERA